MDVACTEVSEPASVLILSPQQLFDEHESRGHEGFNKIRLRHGLPALPASQLPSCKACSVWNTKVPPKKKRKKKKKSNEVATRPFQLWQIDKGYMPAATWKGEFYFQIVVDLYSRKMWVTFQSLKSEDFEGKLINVA